MNIKILVCQIIGPAAAGSAGPVPTPVVYHSDRSALSTARRRRAVPSATALTDAVQRDGRMSA